jgi:uncharacterized protein (TIGR02145 family)
MKKNFVNYCIVTILLMGLITMNDYALDYTITFTGSGASTTVESVIVQNLTKGTTVTVPGGNVLNLNDAPNAVEQLNADEETIRVYPNFVEGKSTVSFFAKQAGSTQLNAFSIDGRKIAGITENLQTGVNSFQLSFPKGSFVIQVVGNGYTYTAKMINQTGTARKPEITYSGTVKPATSAPQKSKSSPSGTTTMTYTTGDQLLYKGTSGNYSTVVTDVLTTSKTINFDFVACADADGNNYTTVTIGTQTWMVENLKTTNYNDGTAIPLVADNTAWVGLNTGAWCDYYNSSAQGTMYGHLYNWYAVSDGRNIAPVGWHVPTDAEWTTLTTYLGGEAVAGGKLKEAGTLNWLSPNTGATNETGFSALSGGIRLDYNGMFSGVSYYGQWWSSTPPGTNNAWSRSMDYDTSSVIRNAGNRATGFSVRCVRDLPPGIDTVKQCATQQQLVAMIKNLGLASVSSSSEVDANSVIRKGDLVEFSYYDDFAGGNYDFKINEQESDKNKMVFYGTYNDNITGATDILRRTVSATSTGLLIKEELKSNGQYVSRGTKEYVVNSDGTVDEYFYKSDGTKSKLLVWRPDGLTSLTKEDANTGAKYKVDNISIVTR